MSLFVCGGKYRLYDNYKEFRTVRPGGMNTRPYIFHGQTEAREALHATRHHSHLYRVVSAEPTRVELELFVKSWVTSADVKAPPRVILTHGEEMHRLYQAIAAKKEELREGAYPED